MIGDLLFRRNIDVGWKCFVDKYPEAQRSLKSFFAVSPRARQLSAVEALSDGVIVKPALLVAKQVSPYPEVRAAAEASLH